MRLWPSFLTKKPVEAKPPSTGSHVSDRAVHVDGVAGDATLKAKPASLSAFTGANVAPTTAITVGGRRVMVSDKDAATLQAVAAQPTSGLHDLPLAGFMALESAFPGVTKAHPHPGYPSTDALWNVSVLLNLGGAAADAMREAMTAFRDPAFRTRTPADKRAVLQALAPALAEGALRRLERFHLPRPAATSTGHPVTLALESETTDLAGIYRYYAPDPTGALDARAITDALKERLMAGDARFTTRVRQPWENRLSDSAWLAGFQWKHLTPDAQKYYLTAYAEVVDPTVTLHRITDPSVTAGGEVAPATLQEKLKWERELRLQMAELITASHYDSLDQAMADRDWIAKRFNGGFHLHAVTELSSAEDKARLGPHMTALAALHDLALFATAAASAASNFTHVFLEPWTAAFASEVSGSLAKGTIDTDVILPHKFHMVGMRTSIYGQPDRLGLEVRGVQPGLLPKFDHATTRMVDLLSDGGVERLAPPPWPGWDAGAKGVGKQMEERARTTMKTRGERGLELEKNAQLSFDDVMEIVVRGSGQKNGFAYASPLWNFEAIPGMGSEDRQRITRARVAFTDTLMVMSEQLSAAVESGRDLDTLAPSVAQTVITAAMAFFQDAGVDVAVERILDKAAAAGKLPRSA